MARMLGKLPPKYDRRTLKLADYVQYAPGLPAPKVQSDWTIGLGPWGMMKNDEVGDCTIAAAGHAIQLWTGWAADKVTPTDDQIVQAYSDISGYIPGQPDTDQGANMLDVLKTWRKVGIAGHKIDAFVALEPRNLDHFKLSIELFGLCYIGLALPLTARDQRVWSVVPNAGEDGRPNSWGGHTVIIPAHNLVGPSPISWGERTAMTWEFLKAYCDEAYALLAPDWINDSGNSPAVFKKAELLTDLMAL